MYTSSLIVQSWVLRMATMGSGDSNIPPDKPPKPFIKRLLLDSSPTHGIGYRLLRPALALDLQHQNAALTSGALVAARLALSSVVISHGCGIFLSVLQGESERFACCG